jgi:hypothetical protein
VIEMPRVVVTTDDLRKQVVMSEKVEAVHLSSDHAASQLLERLSWGVRDAANAERRGKAVAPRRRKAKIRDTAGRERSA